MLIFVVSVIAAIGVTLLFLICTVISLRTVQVKNDLDRDSAADRLDRVADRVSERQGV